MPEPIHRLPARELRERYARAELSPVEVAASALAHAGELDTRLNAFACLDAGRAHAAALASQARWRAGRPASPIDGLPMTVKEFAAVAGWPTRRGSRVTSDAPATESAVFVQRLERAGAVLIGKTRAPEFNWKGVTDSPAFGVTRHPWNPALTPGGSSGGCAAAVAGGVVRASIGSDAGGSVRIPAAFCGVLALKPTFGRIPATPLPSAFFNHVNSGPIAAGIDELAQVYAVVAGPSPLDWTSIGLAPAGGATASVPMRIGLLAPARWADSEPRVKTGLREVMDLLATGGCAIREVDFDVMRASEVSAFFYRLGCVAAVDGFAAGARDRIDPGLVRFIAPAERATMSELMDRMRERDAFANALAALFEQVDVLALPTLPITAFDAGRDTPVGWPSDDWMSWNPYTPAFNGAQVPALSYPVWPTDSALPVGVQFVAPKCREDRLFALGAWLETRLPIRTVGAHGA